MSRHFCAARQALQAVRRGAGQRLTHTLSDDIVSAAWVATPEPSVTGCIDEAVELLIPWRTGPYMLGETHIDSEWRSFEKWNRISPYLPDLSGKRIADIGCSNGYFLFRMAASSPALAIGIDPIDRCWLQFSLVQSLLEVNNVAFLPVGLESMSEVRSYFDVVVCMGVLYHQRNPFEAVNTLAGMLKPGGTLLLESLLIPSADPVLLIPKDRYAKMRNTWSMPSLGALQSLVSRAGLEIQASASFGPLTTSEQRRTKLAPYESLADFLDPLDQSKTVEGYPAPHTGLVVATKR